MQARKIYFEVSEAKFYMISERFGKKTIDDVSRGTSASSRAMFSSMMNQTRDHLKLGYWYWPEILEGPTYESDRVTKRDG